MPNKQRSPDENAFVIPIPSPVNDTIDHLCRIRSHGGSFECLADKGLVREPRRRRSLRRPRSSSRKMPISQQINPIAPLSPWRRVLVFSLIICATGFASTKFLTNSRLGTDMVARVEHYFSSVSPSSLVADSADAVPVKSYFVQAEALYGRIGPSTQHKVQRLFQQGERVAIVETSNGWGKTSEGDYVSLKYLANKAPLRPAKFWVGAEKLFVREAPSLRAQAVGVLALGERLTVSAIRDGWAQVGHNQYVSAKHLSAKKIATNSQVETKIDTRKSVVKVAASSPVKARHIALTDTRVRSGAGRKQKVVGLLKKGEIVDVIAQEGEWLKISANEYVHGGQFMFLGSDD